MGQALVGQAGGSTVRNEGRSLFIVVVVYPGGVSFQTLGRSSSTMKSCREDTGPWRLRNRLGLRFLPLPSET